jgi:hypothetical protein
VLRTSFRFDAEGAHAYNAARVSLDKPYSPSCAASVLAPRTGNSVDRSQPRATCS